MTEIHTGEAVHAILTVIAVTLCVKHKVGVINSLVAEGTEVNDLFVYQQFKHKKVLSANGNNSFSRPARFFEEGQGAARWAALN